MEEKIFEDSETGCCKRFNPEPWDKKRITWTDKLFVTDSVSCILHVPLNFREVLVKNLMKLKAAGALPPEPLLLADEESPWETEIYLAATKEVPDVPHTRISGTFLTKVFEGPYRCVNEWMEEMEEFARSKGESVKKTYIFYTTCPECAKHYGKNYIVLVAEI
ncbi:hypothetical protein KY349_04920 [Candidatus Woesearchaeota archaeon]|nr:hypothetical protein [Candidatus Woesearchaeota archaeon]